MNAPFTNAELTRADRYSRALAQQQAETRYCPDCDCDMPTYTLTEEWAADEGYMFARIDMLTGYVRAARPRNGGGFDYATLNAPLCEGCDRELGA